MDKLEEDFFEDDFPDFSEEDYLGEGYFDDIFYMPDDEFDVEDDDTEMNDFENDPHCCSKPVYICSARPLVTDDDFEYLRRCCCFAEEHNTRPITPLLFYADDYDMTDPHIRSKILSMTRGWIWDASEVWVFDGEPPEELMDELLMYEEHGKTVRFFRSDGDSFLPEEAADIPEYD